MKISRIILIFIAISTKLVLQIFLTSSADDFQYPDTKFKKRSGVTDLLHPLRRHAQKDARSKRTVPPFKVDTSIKKCETGDGRHNFETNLKVANFGIKMILLKPLNHSI